ncbi:hypothetical protein EDB83DRAFT_2228509 [Lactarius deliciosus]|nr:hypothetical protein EDB83DRAFT_2228509 [Lactarius deliciosus]
MEEESEDPGASSSLFQQPPYPGQIPAFHVRTPSDTFQSPYTLSVVPRGSHSDFEREPSVASSISTSSSSRGPSPFNLPQIPSRPQSQSRRGAARASSFNPQALAEPTWSDACQARFEERVMRITAAAGFPLSWVENPEWLDFCNDFVPQAKSPSRKVLTKHLLPQTLNGLQQAAKQRVSGKNVTASCDGWTGENFHHYIAFMIMVDKKVWHSYHNEHTVSD